MPTGRLHESILTVLVEGPCWIGVVLAASVLVLPCLIVPALVTIFLLLPCHLIAGFPQWREYNLLDRHQKRIISRFLFWCRFRPRSLYQGLVRYLTSLADCTLTDPARGRFSTRRGPNVHTK